MKTKKGQTFVITGTLVVRGVQVLAGLFLIWELVKVMLGWGPLEVSVIIPLIISLVCSEISL